MIQVPPSSTLLARLSLPVNRFFWIRLLAFAAVFSFVSPGYSLDASPQDRERARGLMDQGDELMAARDFRGALEAYQAAHEIVRVPTTGLEVGRAQRNLGLLLEARDSWIQVTRYPRSPDEPKPFTDARREAEVLAVQIEDLIPTIEIAVESGPGGDEVRLRVDGVLLSGSPLGVPFRINPGEHEIIAEAEGYSSITRRVTLEEGKSERLVLRFTAKEDAAAEPVAVAAPRESSTSWRPIVAWSSLGVGVAGVAVGSVFGARAMTKANAAEEYCEGTSCLPEADDDITASKRAGTVSTAAFIVGGLGVGAGVFLLLTGSSRSKAEGEQRASTGIRQWSIASRTGGATLLVRGAF